MIHCKFEEAVSFGEYAKEMCLKTKNVGLKLQVLLLLFTCYTKMHRVHEMYKIWQNIQFMGKNCGEYEEALTWFYALSIEMLLKANDHKIISYDSCDNFYQHVSANKGKKFSDAQNRFLVNFAVWNFKIGCHEKSEIVVEKILMALDNQKDINSISSSLMRIETHIKVYNLLKVHYLSAKINHPFAKESAKIALKNSKTLKEFS
jgi:hypothetical protein